jgi:formylglycine-generating enzyme required for sulfatase activity
MGQSTERYDGASLTALTLPVEIGAMFSTAGRALVAALLLSAPARALELDPARERERPGVRLLALLVVPASSSAGSAAAMTFTRLLERDGKQGLRGRVVVVAEGGACVLPAWAPRGAECDGDGSSARVLGFSGAAPAAWLWTWRGVALVRGGTADAVAAAVPGALAANPRVVVEAQDERSRVSPELAATLRDETARQAKFSLVPPAQEAAELDAIQGRWLGAAAEHRRACELRDDPATYVLRAKLNGLTQKKELALTFLSGDVSCTLAAATVPFDPARRADSVREALTALVAKIPRVIDTPMAASAKGFAPTVRVPAGPFWRGCNEAKDRACDRHEAPGRTLELAAFDLDTTEVTVAAFATCVDKGKCQPIVALAPTCNWGRPGYEQHPINCVTWDEARDYCAFAGKRLPTEAEWEKAARGPDGRVYPWGSEPATCRVAVMDEGGKNGCGRGPGTWPVATKPEGVSPYGAYDMAGNVAEWVADLYDPLYYQSAPGRDPTGPTAGEMRVYRGGGYFDSPVELRASYRARNAPGMRNGALGFRCARSAEK